ncbi:MAG: hypothetical protein V5A44_06755 [Haloarculaceae archaeon]
MDWRGVAVALVVVAAGCGSVVGGGDEPEPAVRSPETPSPTLTPAPVPEVTATPVTLPPGVTGASVTDTAALYAAHRDYLRGRSYTLRVRVEAGSQRSERLFGVETPTRYYRHDLLPGRNFTRFADGDRVYVRTAIGGNELFASSDDVDPPTAHTVRLSKAFLQLAEVDVAETLVDGRLHYELSGSYPVHPTVESLHDVTVRAVLSPQGFIRSLNVSYVATGGNSPTNVSRSFAYSDIDTTTVERPPWVDREFNDTGE